MLRKLALGALLAGGSAMALYVTAGEGQAAAPGGCVEIYAHEPVLIYDVTGATLLGPTHEHLTLYNDGFASYSSVSGLQLAGFEARTAQVSKKEVSALLRALTEGGAFQLCDQQMVVMDVPLKTITVLRGGGDAFAHSFNYWLGVNQFAAADAAVRAFVQTNFPGV